MKAPFPYFGGKSKAADLIWQILGQPRHYIEPFFGSGAVLLARPNFSPNDHIETVNDADGMICNVWRSIKYSPNETANWCDWPVNHADLAARKAELIRNESKLLDGLISDPNWHDPVVAGYWIWAASCWIGSGLMSQGAIPNIARRGHGVHSGQRPHLTSGHGVNAMKDRGGVYQWFDRLSARLRYVRIVCGDWSRVCGGSWQDKMGTVGIFFDPPYSDKKRSKYIYTQDSMTVANDVRQWCIERGKKESYRIILAGYTEHEELVNYGWKKIKWIAGGGYANLGKGKNENRKRETLWCSPYCLTNDLFDR